MTTFKNGAKLQKVQLAMLDTDVQNKFSGYDETLAQSATQQNSRTINGLYPPSSLTACKGDGSTDDTSALQAIVNYANTNGYSSIYLPPTTNGYIINGTITLYSGIEIFGGRTKITSSSLTSVTDIFFANNCNNVRINGLKFYSTNNQARSGRNGQSSNRIAVQFSTCTDCFVSDLYGSQLEYLVKIDTSSQSIWMRNLETSNVLQPIYIGDSSNDMYMENLILGCPTETNTDSLDHAIYLHACNNIHANNITCKQGNGASIQIYNDQGTTAYNFHFSNVLLQNVRTGIVCYTAQDVHFSNLTIDGINTTTAICYGISVNNAEVFITNLKVRNIQSLMSGALFNTDGSTSATLEINGGYIDNCGTQNLSTFNNNGDCIIQNVIFNLCEGHFFSGTTANHRKFVIKNCTFLRNATPSSTPPSIELFRFQGTNYAEVANNTFINAQSNARGIVYCTNNTVTSIARGNVFKGDTAMLSSADTQSKAFMNIDANNNYVKTFVLEQGATGSRPSNPSVGQTYYDTTLGKPIYCKVGGGTPTWTDATGATV